METASLTARRALSQSRPVKSVVCQDTEEEEVGPFHFRPQLYGGKLLGAAGANLGGWPAPGSRVASSMGVVGLELPFGSFQGSLALIFVVVWTCPNSISITGERRRTRESPNES